MYRSGRMDTQSQGFRRLQAALDGFSRLLTPLEQSILSQTGTTAAEAVTELSSTIFATKNNRRRRVGTKLLPFLNFVQSFGGVIGVFIQAEPETAALIWGSVKFVVQLAAGYFEYFSRIEDLFEKIGSLCPRIERIGNLFPDSSKLREEIWGFYAIIIEFCTQTVRFLKSSAHRQFLRSAWKSFKAEFKEFEIMLKEKREAIDDEILIAVQNSAFQANQSALIHRRNSYGHQQFELEQWAKNRSWQVGQEFYNRTKKLETIFYKLSPHDHSRPFNNARDRRHPDTGKWFFDLQSYKLWKKSSTSNVLWYHGIVGAGKTILATSLIEHILEYNRGTQSCIAYFFCDFQTPESLGYRTILSSLLKQLIFMSQPLSSWLEETLEAAYLVAPHPPDVREIERMLTEVIKSLGRVYLIIDGIDECTDNDRLDLFSCLKRLIRASPKNLKIMLSSRPEVDIPRLLNITYEISLESVENRSELSAYITYQLEERCLNLQHHSTELIEDVKKALLKGADGMFLWVFFQLEDIKRLGSEADIRHALNHLPRGLHETYERILQRIHEQRDPREAILVFKWLAECRRLLTLEELTEAISIRPGDTRYVEIYSRFNKDPLGIIRNCCNLVIQNEGDSTVQFAHSSIAEYLQSYSWKLGTDHEYDQLVDLEVADLCATYLLLRDFESQVASKPTEYPVIQSPAGWLPTIFSTFRRPFVGIIEYASKFAMPAFDRTPRLYSTEVMVRQYVTEARPLDELSTKYALLRYVAENWLHHFGVANRASPPPILSKLLLDVTLPFPYLPYMTSIEKPDWKILVIWACENDNLTLFREITSNISWSKRYNGNKDTDSLKDVPILFHAARHGSVKVVQHLLSRYSNIPNTNPDNLRYFRKIRQGVGGVTPFTIAAKTGHLAIIDLFVSALRLRSGACYYLALPTYVAAESGQLETVKRLVQARLEINPVTPQVAFGGEKDGPPGIADYSWLLPLKMASKAGHIDIVHYLCEQGFFTPNLYSNCSKVYRVTDHYNPGADGEDLLYDEPRDQELEPTYKDHFWILADALEPAVRMGHRDIATFLLPKTRDFRSLIPALSSAISRGEIRMLRLIVGKIKEVFMDPKSTRISGSLDCFCRKVCFDTLSKASAPGKTNDDATLELLWELQRHFYWAPAIIEQAMQIEGINPSVKYFLSDLRKNETGGLVPHKVLSWKSIIPWESPRAEDQIYRLKIASLKDRGRTALNELSECESEYESARETE